MANKMNGESVDLTAHNIARLKELFPEVLTDGEKIDFDMLKTILGEVVDTEQERYQFTWHGKKRMIAGAQKPSKGTLRPVPEKSKNFDMTENLYIEGDNLEVLKLLQKSYNSKIKMIYIDPPYNTGNDFVYKDNFKDGVQNYLEQTGQLDIYGNIISTNSESNGRFHTDWLNMMYARLKLAKNLLTNDGVIFISIDDKEYSNLKKISDELFGEKNFITTLVWEKKKKGSFLDKHSISFKEYILVYAKNEKTFNGLLGEINTDSGTYPCIKTTNARGIRIIRKGTKCVAREKNILLEPNTRISSGNMELIYLNGLKIEDGILMEDATVESNWIYTQSKLDEFSQDNLVYITQDLYIRRIVEGERRKMLKDLLTRVGIDGKSESYFIYDQNLYNHGWGTNEDANNELHNLLDKQNLFDFSKPSKLISKLIQSVQDKEMIVLDFFSGSATTAHATMQLNAEDGGKRKFIMVQLPEILDEKSEAYKDGYRTICDIGEERIRRAGEKIKEDLRGKQQNAGMLDENTVDPESLDIGFKVLKLDTSNIREWNVDFANLEDELDLYETPFVDGRSELDIVYEIMLKQGLELTYPIETFEVNGQTVYDIAFGSLFVCLSHKITPEIARAIIARRDEQGTETSSVIFSDAGFSNDSDKLNCIEILKDAGYPEDNLLTI